MKYAYYPGCSLHSTGDEFDRSLLAVCERLGVELVEVEKWLCCGSSAAHGVSRLMSIALPMANLALLPKMGLDEVVVPCASCFSKFKIAQHNVKTDKKLRRDVVEAIHKDCNIEAKVIHPLSMFVEEPLLLKIPALIKRNLSGLKVVCYYGCLLTRPHEVTQFDIAENPETMDKVLSAAGIATLDWSHKTICCGASFSLSKPDIAVNLSHNIIQDARSAGADAIAVACPMCHSNLDTRQDDMEKEYGIHPQMPVLYFTQLMGYSFGLSSEELLINKHLTDAESILEKVSRHALVKKQEIKI
ncbi:MAG: CoB--CoM heterodisulfide reductase iron-sulfur subunit B family protein [Deltaproteobacteria bacterium]|nr:CoB--CoM heterodisulfide reductase iron-sulfur subunit B family protein [Deltaproteobacteria bacterium]